MIILDVKLPDWSGTKTLKKIRELPEGQCSEVIMITAYEDKDAPIDAIKPGVFDYIKKPFKPEELVISVKRAMQFIRLEREKEDFILSLQERESELEKETMELEKFRHRYRNLITALTTLYLWRVVGRNWLKR